MTEILVAMGRPLTNGQVLLPSRTGPKGLLPSTWLERPLTERALSSVEPGLGA